MTGMELFGYISYGYFGYIIGYFGYITQQSYKLTNKKKTYKNNTDSWAYRINEYINKSTSNKRRICSHNCFVNAPCYCEGCQRWWWMRLNASPPGPGAIIRCNLCVKCHASIFPLREQFRNALTLLKFVSHINSIRPALFALINDQCCLTAVGWRRWGPFEHGCKFVQRKAK